MAKKVWAMLLCVCLTLGMLAGCGSNNDGGKGNENESSESSTGDNPQGSNGEEEVSADAPSWKRDTTPITIDWFVAYDWFGKLFDPVNNMGDKKLLESTGITINFITGDYEKLNALITTGELPDIVTFDAMASQRKMIEDAGMVMSLDELSEIYAQDLYVPQDQKDWYRNEDGNWYSLISFFYGDERCNEEFGGYLSTHNKNFVRADLLEQIGMTMDDLTTKEGFYQACKAIKDQHIQYNGMDVIPFYGIYAPAFAYQFGMQLEDSEGNYHDPRTQPEYLETLKYFNKFYNEGLLATDNFTMGSNKAAEYISSGRVFMVHGWPTVDNYRDTLYNSDPEAKLLFADTIKTGDSGKQHYLNAVASSGWTASMISANTKYADRIITLFSYLTQEEATLDEIYGTDCWEIKDGVCKILSDKQLEYESDHNAYNEKYITKVNFLVDWTIIQRYEDSNPDNILDKDFVDSEHAQASELFDTKCFLDILPPGGTDLAATNAAIDEYWNSMEPKMFMAQNEEECEKLYYQALEQINSMGFGELSEYWNERFQANKAKLGVEYAWPSLQ